MFKGRFELTIDDKGRINIPAKFRDILRDKDGGRLVVTNFDTYLVAYPHSEWLAFEQRANNLPKLTSDQKKFLRVIISGAVECALDKQGRILIPPVLRCHAELDRDIVLAGVLDKMELWNKHKWDEEFNASMKNFENISSAAEELGI